MRSSRQLGFLRGGAPPPTQVMVDFIDAYRNKWGVRVDFFVRPLGFCERRDLLLAFFRTPSDGGWLIAFLAPSRFRSTSRCALMSAHSLRLLTFRFPSALTATRTSRQQGRCEMKERSIRGIAEYLRIRPIGRIEGVRTLGRGDYAISIERNLSTTLRHFPSEISESPPLSSSGSLAG
jgi:hypothetical protein